MTARVAIVDYGMGNVFSVLHACRSAGLEADVTAEAARIADAHAVILPGVGAFGDAMRELDKRDLVQGLERAARTGKPFVGICLGMQLMMDESQEFGSHRGLGLVAGSVVRLDSPREPDGSELKVPTVGWNSIHTPASAPERWRGTLLQDVPDATWMYFVHSYYCTPHDRDVVASVSRYGQIEYCSTFVRENLFGCQYHPERSAANGLKIYRRLAQVLAQ